MKKTIKLILIVIGIIIALMIVLPFTMKDKITAMVKMEASNLLDARFDFQDLSISLFRNFPDASIYVKRVSLVGNGLFAGDTLLAADELGATVNILSLFGNEGFQVKEVLLNKPLVQGIVTADGKANWEIVRKNADSEEQVVTPDESAVSLHLNELKIKEGEIRYRDFSTDTDLELHTMNMRVSGNFDESRTDMKTRIDIASVNVKFDKQTYVKNMRLEAEVDMDADLANKRFTFNDNRVAINAIETAFEGWVAFPDSSQMDMDVKLNTSKINFREILSLIPAVYKNDFDKLTAGGTVALNAYARGVLKKECLPEMKLTLQVENGEFHYTHLPEKVTDIQINASVTSPGGAVDLLKASVDRFHFLLGANPFDLTASATNMKSDLQFALSAAGRMNLSQLRAVYPLPDSLSVDGLLTADLKIAGSMEQLDKKHYEKIKADGKLQLEQFDLKQGKRDPIAIRSAVLFFTPQFVELQQFEASMGKNDLQMKGRLEQFIPYFLKNETLRGSLQVTSGYLCLNDFMTPADSLQTSAGEPARTDTASGDLLVIPKNLDLTTEINFKQVILDKIDLTAIQGKMQVKDGRATLNGLRFHAFGGSAGAAGVYDSSMPESPSLDMAFEVKDASFAKTFAVMPSLQKMAPVFENMEGTYAMSMAMRSRLARGMTLDLNSVDANGTLQSSDVRISGVAALDRLAEAIKYPALKTITPKDLHLRFVVRDGKIKVDPFKLNVGDAVITLGGVTGLDQSIDYSGTVALGGNGLSAFGINIKQIPFTMTGTFKSPQIALDTKSVGASVASEVAGAAGGLLKGLKKKFQSAVGADSVK